MYDVGLKPRMIRTLLKEDVPDDKIPFDSPSKLSRIISCIQSHKLLSEPSITDNNKQVERWKSSVNDWVTRLLSLISKTTTTSDKCWAGICLLGVTCQECNADRFLGSYAAWFDKMLTHIQVLQEEFWTKVGNFELGFLVFFLIFWEMKENDTCFNVKEMIFSSAFTVWSF